jgi:salicylate hydroxylase
MRKTDVAIIGGGIGGITLALALQRQGIACLVFERVSAFRQVGAGIQIAPNASKLLIKLGLWKELNASGVRPTAQTLLRWADERTLVSTPLDHVENTFGAPHYTFHRADLHRAILSGLKEGTIQFGKDLTMVDQGDHAVHVTFQDGSKVQARVVVGADGIHSKARGLLAEDSPRFSGQNVFRGLIPSDRLAPSVELSKVRIWIGPNQHCGCYPISSGKTISFAATVPAVEAGEERWTAPGNKDDLLELYNGWNPTVRQMFEAADDVTLWALYDRAPLKSYVNHRLVLIGDAAHPMLPFLSQGANQAIEDALALSVFLAKSGLTEFALQSYADFRLERTNTIQASSLENCVNFHLPDGIEQERRDRKLSAAGMSGLNSDAQQWLYGYDAEREAAAFRPLSVASNR